MLEKWGCMYRNEKYDNSFHVSQKGKVYLSTKTKVFQKTEASLGCQIGSLDSSCTSVESKD